MLKIFLAALGVALLPLAAAVSASALEINGENKVAIEAGEIRGAEAEGIYSFKGIPYAAPPVGELRWVPPARVEP